ncbi:hypothetical protein D3C80_1985770 [compost metagenome]
MGLCQSMVGALIDLEGRMFDDLDRGERRSADRHDLVVVAVQYERWLVESLQVLMEIAFRKGADAV